MRLRKVLLVSLLALALPVAAASLASACTALATMRVSSGVAPGQTITGTGRAFNGGGHGTPAGTTPVELRWNTRSGPLMAMAIPADAAGNISFSFVAPNVPPGSYVLIGVQTNPANGTPFYGTPARQTVTIVAGSSRSTERAAEGSEVATAEQQAAPGGSAASSASAAPAASTGQASASSAAGSAAGGRPVTPAAAATGRSTAAAPIAAAADPRQAAPSADSADSAAGAASSAQPSPAAPVPDVVTTVTRALAASSGSESGLPVAALLLMALGLGLVLTVSGRWITGRMPRST